MSRCDRRHICLRPLALCSNEERAAPDVKMTNSWRAQVVILVMILASPHPRPCVAAHWDKPSGGETQ
ncbi:MAG: hypothetical protein FJ291_18055 [Planctomycetes bacterium]|nr:hypothetical protein [Planctomycetota bacterium]